MSRFDVAAVVVLAALCGVVSGAEADKSQAPHLGVWTLAASDGSKITLSMDAKRLTWEAAMPGKGTTTLTVPGHAISQEGVLFGYIGSAEWTDGINQSKLPDGRQPFACRLKATENSLTISELVMFGADENGCKAMSGVYRKSQDHGNVAGATRDESQIAR